MINKIIKPSSVILLLLALFVASCSKPVGIPEDLEGKKTYLQDLKKQLKDLNEKIDTVKLQIAALEPAVEKVKTPVNTLTVKEVDFKKFTELQGNVESSDAVFIAAEMGGRITSLTIDEGDYVKKGQIVGKVDMETTRKSKAEVETSLELAMQTYDRQKRLWDQEIGSEIQFLQAKNNVERLQKSLETIQSQLSKENIISPLSGYVDQMFQKAGELAAPGNPIAQVIKTSVVKVIVDVPENLVSSVKRRDQVEINFPALDKTVKSRISKVGRTINSANRTFEIEMDIQNSNGQLKPNLLALVKLNDKTIPKALTVPIEAVQQDVAGNSFLYIVAEGEDGPYAKKTIVTTSISNDGIIVIESGLTAGDQVITDGGRSLVPQDLIKIVDNMSTDLENN